MKLGRGLAGRSALLWCMVVLGYLMPRSGVGGGGRMQYADTKTSDLSHDPTQISSRITAATTITLPASSYRLRRVKLSAGTTPGSFSIIYDGISVAHFPCPSDATTGQATWNVDWPVGGLVFTSGIQAFNGGVSAVMLTFSKTAGGPPMSAYRAIRFTVTTAGTHANQTNLTATTYDGGESVPDHFMALGTVVGYSAYMPAIGAVQAFGDADFKPGEPVPHEAGTLPPATTLTPAYTNTTAAGTLDVYVFYHPVA